MHNYAIAEIAGYQYRIAEGGQVVVPRLEAEEGSKLTIEKILLVNNDGTVKVGAPYLEGVKAEASVVEHHRGRKVRVLHKKRRKGYRKVNTQRQYLTTLEIQKVSA